MLTQHCCTAVVSAGGIQQLSHAQSQLDVDETTVSLPTSLLPWALLLFSVLKIALPVFVLHFTSQSQSSALS